MLPLSMGFVLTFRDRCYL